MFSHATFVFSSSNIAALKKALRRQYPEIGSSHADEALAASLGFKSYAAMLHILRQVGDTARLIVGADHFLLFIRLKELGYRNLFAESLRRILWGMEFPVRPYDDMTMQAIEMLRRPNAANSS